MVRNLLKIIAYAYGTFVLRTLLKIEWVNNLNNLHKLIINFLSYEKGKIIEMMVYIHANTRLLDKVEEVDYVEENVEWNNDMSEQSDSPYD